MAKYMKIRDTALNVCRIGLGTANAGLAWDGAASFRMLDAYVDRGGNLIDTARIYSDWVKPEVGRSERVVGDWIRHRKRHDDVIVMTKGGHPRLDAMHVSRLSRSEMEADLTMSLRALSMDCVDVYCYHRDDGTLPAEKLIESMESFVRAGKIRYYACSNWNTGRMKLADAYSKKMGYRGFVLNQALYNYGSERMKPFPDKTMVTADAEMLAYHAGNASQVLAPYMSLCSGFFHALDGKGEEAGKDSPYFTSENLAIYQRIKQIAAAHNTGITQVLLGFILTREPHMLPLIGVSSLQQLDEVMAAFDGDFKSEEFDFAVALSQEAPGGGRQQ